MNTVALVVAYVVAAAVIVQWVPVVKERRLAPLVAHTVALAVVIAVWADKGQYLAAAVNGAWLIVATAWYLISGATHAGSRHVRHQESEGG